MSCLFEENQRFTQWWLWVILFVSFALSIISDINNISVYYLLIMILTTVFIYSIKLRVSVNNKGIYYQFFPFHLKVYHIRIEDIKAIEAVEYSPIKDYGGWGIRYGFKGKAYNVSGNKGVKIYLKNSRNILFGSQKHQEFEKSLQQHLNSIS